MNFILIFVIGIWQMKRKKSEKLSESKNRLHFAYDFTRKKSEEKRNKEVK